MLRDSTDSEFFCTAEEAAEIRSVMTGEPCIFCRREIPCECGGATCMCTCGLCMAEPLPVYTGPVDPDWLRGRLA